MLRDLTDFPGYRELQAARQALAGAERDRAQISIAAQHLWGAIFYRDDWPPALQERTDALQPVLFKHGTIAMTVGALDHQELKELHGVLSEFIDDAEDLIASSTCS